MTLVAASTLIASGQLIAGVAFAAQPDCDQGYHWDKDANDGVGACVQNGNPNETGSPSAPPNVNICHQNGNGSYVEIPVDPNGYNGHGDHSGDIIPAPADGCPTGTPTTTTPPPTTTTPPPPIDCPPGQHEENGECVPNGPPNVNICHLNGNGSYVEIPVDPDGYNGHGDHSGDIIPAPADGCPTGTPTTPPPVVCDPGFHEDDGVCVPDTTPTTPPPVVCDPGFHEENGVCVPDTIVCPPGQHEENGQCVPDPIQCPEGQHEENGQCVPDPVVCPPAEHEENGICVPNGGGPDDPDIDIRITPSHTSAAQGDDVRFVYIVTNTGDTVLVDVTVTSRHAGPLGSSRATVGSSFARAVGELDPGASVRLSTSIEVLKTDGPLIERATAVGSSPENGTVADVDSADVTVVAAKTVTPAAHRTKTPPSGIAFTGAEGIVPLSLIALALLLFGSFALWFASRRKHGDQGA